MDTTITLGRTHHTVHIDGHDLSRHVRSVKVEADAGQPASNSTCPR